MKGPFSRHSVSDWISVPAEPPSPRRTEISAAPEELFCPRCHGPLIDARSLGLCQSCGYCRSLEKGSELSKLPGNVPRWITWLGLLQFCQMLGLVPVWAWGVLTAVLAVLPVCYLVNQQLPVDCPQRTYWSTTQLGLGLAAVLAAQVWALVFLRKQGERVGLTDLLSPSHLWYLTLRWVPRTNGAIALAGGGVTAALTAVLWIGGLSYWLSIEDAEEHEPPTIQANLKQENVEPNLEKKVEELWARALKRQEKRKTAEQPRRRIPSSPIIPAETASRLETPSRSPTERPVPEDRPDMRCVITGYILDGTGELTGLSVATLREGKLISAGVVHPDLSVEARGELLKRLSVQRRNTPAIDAGPLQAVWVNPVVLCTVSHSGADDQGQFVEPALKEVIDDE
jgi:hypothetical protein